MLISIIHQQEVAYGLSIGRTLTTKLMTMNEWPWTA